MEISMSQAWLIAALTRAEKIPSYKDFMSKEETKKEQSAEQMFAMVKLMNSALGGD